MKKKKSIFAIITLFSVLLLGCPSEGDDKNEYNTGSQFNEQEFFENIDQTNITVINEVVESFSSPIEMAALMKDYNIPYSKDYMASTKIIGDYSTNIKKSIGLGILSADLGYLNVYEKKTSMIDYLLSINSLAQDLRVSQFFDFQTLKKLVTTSDNVDSLMFLSVNSYHQIDAYFRQTNRSHLSALSVTGVWIESLYLITQVAKDNEFKNFKDQIGSQKELLEKLVVILKIYEGHPYFDKLLVEFKNLQEAFSGVSIETVKTEGKIEITGDIVVIYPDEETVVIVSDEDLQKIIKATEKTRNTIIAL